MTPEPYPSLPRTALLLLATLLAAGVLATLAIAFLDGWPELLRMALPTEIALLGATLWAVRRTRLGWREALLWRPLERDAWAPLALILVGSVTVFSELYLVMQRIVPVPEAFERAMRELLGISGRADLIVTVAVAVVIAPILEEALFRGVILQGLARRHGPRAATVWTALAFALFHFYNPWQLVPTFFLGLVLAWLVLTTGTIRSAILVHGAFNAISLVVYAAPLDRSASGGSPAWIVVGVIAFFLAGSLGLLAGLAWLEGRMGGGWFSAVPPAGSPPLGEPAAPGGDGYTEPAGSPTGPSAARR
ncbi:MAG TPA: CPBP family intramembrane glutamic endopeptidase [Gemmatimonadota bacterium]|nr:CPBP family intramembrane glutamic endopeptidase [Gemmatimonadota bacterium]